MRKGKRMLLHKEVRGTRVGRAVQPSLFTAKQTQVLYVDNRNAVLYNKNILSSKACNMYNMFAFILIVFACTLVQAHFCAQD